jgi:hypothetical protein
MRCTVELNCSGMSTRLAGALVTCNRGLDTCELGCVPGAVRPFFIPVLHSLLGSWGTLQYQSSPLGEAMSGLRGSAGAHLDREVRSGAKEHMAAPELSSQGGRAQSHGTHDSVGAHLGREARSEVEERVAAPKLNSASRRGLGPRATWQHRSSPQQGGKVRGRGTCGGSGAHLYREL